MELPPELYALTCASVDDPDSYRIAADWLQQRGDPRGELIALALAAGNKAASARAVELQARLDPYGDGWILEWRWGFVRRARRFGYLGADPNAWRSFLRSEPARFVREVLDQAGGEQFHEFLLENPPRAVRELATNGSTRLDRVVAALPHLQRLALYENFTAVALVAPQLRELAFTIRNPNDDAGWLARSELPRVARLRLAIPRFHDGRPVLRTLRNLPALRELAIVSDAPIDTDELRRELRLERLEVMGDAYNERGQHRELVIGRSRDNARIGFLRLHGAEVGRLVVPAKPEVVLGGLVNADVVLDKSAQLRHAVVARRNGAWFIVATPSPTGVHVNGTLVATVELQNRDELELSNTRLRFVAGDVEREAAQLRTELGL
jgi:uncharacterized protein (TIGR02996 family)